MWDATPEITRAVTAVWAKTGNQGNTRLREYTFSPETGVQILGALMGTDATQVGVLPGDLSRYLQEFYPGDPPPFLSEFTRSSSPLPAIESVPVRQRLARATEEEYEGILMDFVQKRIAHVLGTSPSRLDVQQSLNTMGLDSLMVVELRNRFRSGLDIDIPMAQFLTDISALDLARQFKTQLTAMNRAAAPTSQTHDHSLSSILSTDRLLEEAARQTGLTDFGEDGFREPLDILLGSLREEARLNELGVFTMHRDILRLLTNRLLTEKAFADDPSMNDTPVDRPLFILGFPRTGTTLLHNLLACDPNARWLRLWEGLYPAPAPRSLTDDPRIEQAEQWVADLEKFAPRSATAHKLVARGPEECLWLMEHTFADMIFGARAPIPGYAEWLMTQKADADPRFYRYYRRQLQMLGAHCRGRHWVLKAPRHLSGLAGLLAVFPDARIVQTHRDPSAVLPSMCSLSESLQSPFTDGLDKHALGANSYRQLKWSAEQAREARAPANPAQFFDVHYKELVADPIGTARRIYDYHGYEYSGRFEANMKKWLDGNPRHKHGVHRYTLEEYGLDEGEIRRDFGDGSRMDAMIDPSGIERDIPIGKERSSPRQLPRGTAEKAGISYPLSHGQRALWFIHWNAPDSAAYNTGWVTRVLSPIDGSILRAVFQTLLDRHPSLRNTFSEQDGQPIRIVHDDQEVHFEEIDASVDTEEELHRRVTAAYRHPFDLEQGPLLRVSLFTRAQEDHVLLVTIHHIVTDGWSLWMLLSEFLTLYASRKTDRSAALPPLRWQYQDFVAWQAELLKGPEGERLWEYWREQLSDAPPILDLPTDRPRPPVQSDNGASFTFTLSETLTQKLKEQARTSGATLYMILLAAFQVLLHRYTGQEDILVGSPTAGRSRPEFEGILGYFVNPIVLRARLEGDPAFDSFLNQVRRTVLEGLDHQDYPFPLLVERLRPARDASRSPLFQVSFALQRPQNDDELSVFLNSDNENPGVNKGGLLLAPFKMGRGEGQFDLTLMMLEVKQSLNGVFRYSTDLFDTEMIERMAGHFQCLLEGIVAELETRISQLPLLTEAERQRILVEWNDTKTPYPADKCVHELFEEQAAKSPDAIAVVFEDEEISYGELNARANRLAHRLRKLGVGPEVLVGLFVERSVEMVVGLLGILKAGGAYVPLDPEYPTERLAFMAEDAGLKILLCHGATRERIPECAARILELDAEAEAIAGESPENPEQLGGPDNLAYVIYTSGSTGRPKGVMIEHRNVSNFLHGMGREPGFSDQDVLLSVTTLSFDICALEIFLPLLFGGRLVVAGRTDAQDGRALARLIDSRDVKFLQATPATWRLLEAQGWQHCSMLKALCGGEALPGDLANALSRNVSTSWNMYGPTETTIWSLAKRILPGEAVSIGRPIANTRVYILDARMEPVPIGVPGELYIGGAGVARGYLNRPDLTAEKFIPDPFRDDTIGDGIGARLYRTGDLCRWLPDGNIEFMGRIDTQVKIRGFRIECGEVENALLAYPGIREVVVDARGEGTDKRLVAWLGVENAVLEDGGPSGQSIRDALRTHLRGQLPGWMVPARFVFVEELPLTPSGKIDRRALPAPDAEFDTGTEYAPPRDPVEGMLCSVFTEALGVGRAGIHDNFFDLGGHSLLAIRMLSLLRERLGVELPLRVLFEHPTPAGLAGEARAREEWQPTILFPLKTGLSKSGNPKPPLFCIHPVGGGALCYRELADCLDEDQPVYGIQAVGFEGKLDPLTDIESMAARYVEEIAAVWPEGPCRLYGWSFGGVVAFEMARLLQATGREVDLLVLADTGHPYRFENREVPDEDDIMVYLLAEAGGMEESLFEEVRGMTGPDRRLLLQERWRATSNPAGLGELDRFARVYRANFQALRAYRSVTWV